MIGLIVGATITFVWCWIVWIRYLRYGANVSRHPLFIMGWLYHGGRKGLVLGAVIAVLINLVMYLFHL